MSNWQPSATIAALQTRAAILRTIREFFYARDVYEVETPQLSHASVTDTYIASIKTADNLYLQTSPEYGMKRLLAAGSGSIFQLGKAYRNEESGRFHNPEFTMLEWYRVGFDHQQLMLEVADLLKQILPFTKVIQFTYQEVFQRYLDLDYHAADKEQLARVAIQSGIQGVDDLDKDGWSHLLMSEIIEPQLPRDQIVFIYDYPATQAALARIRYDERVQASVAERFECYINGIELANGFHELADANEQAQRFQRDLKQRQALGFPAVPIDQHFLAALAHGLPDCAGVALGIDRLVMLALNATHINEVIAFPFARA